MEPVRSFIAIELPDSVKCALSELQVHLKKEKVIPVKWVDPDSIHLTIKFLGNIDRNAIPVIEEAISQSTRGISEFSLELTEAGAFPNLRAPRVVWVGIGGETTILSSIRDNLDKLLIASGFEAEKRAFSPHLTLGRVREKASTGERRLLGEAVASLRLEHMPSFTVTTINLMRSILTREGAQYSRLAEVVLRGD